MARARSNNRGDRRLHRVRGAIGASTIVGVLIASAPFVSAQAVQDSTTTPVGTTPSTSSTATSPSAPGTSISVPTLPTPTTTPSPQERPDRRDGRGRIIGPSPVLDVVPVYSVVFEGLASRLAGVLDELAMQHSNLEAAQGALVDNAERRDALTALIGRAEIRHRKLVDEADLYRAAQHKIAVKAYTTNRLDELLGVFSETPEEALRRKHDEMLLSEATRIVTERAHDIAERSEVVEASLERWRDHSKTTDETIAKNLAVAQDAIEQITVLDTDVARLRDSMDKERPMTIVEYSDMPFSALDAYWRAANSLAVTQPSCKIQWWLLAGVGRTESNHGRMQGAQMTADGSLTAPIIGIPLDGTNNTRAVPDSDGGRLDFDTVWDRAVGPMQFIPGTWGRWGTDGSGDGVADPHNLYDAALSAGRLLCSGAPLDTMAGLRAAVLRYNRSESYVDLVLARGYEYAALPVPAGLIPAPTDPAVIAAIGEQPQRLPSSPTND